MESEQSWAQIEKELYTIVHFLQWRSSTAKCTVNDTTVEMDHKLLPL